MQPCSSAAQKNTPQIRCPLAAGTLGRWRPLGAFLLMFHLEAEQSVHDRHPESPQNTDLLNHTSPRVYVHTHWHLIYPTHPQDAPLCQGRDRPYAPSSCVASWIDAQQCSHVPTRRLPDGIQPAACLVQESTGGGHPRPPRARCVVLVVVQQLQSRLGLQAPRSAEAADDARGRVRGGGPNPNLSPNPEIEVPQPHSLSFEHTSTAIEPVSISFQVIFLQRNQ